MNESSSSALSTKPKLGCGAFIAILIIVFIIGGLSFNEAAGYYYENCTDREVFDCFLNRTEESQPTGVLAKGTYTFKGHSVNIFFTIPLDGGDVGGHVEGACDGKVQGTFDGKEILTGTITGTCDPFFVKIPASAKYDGRLNKTSKKVNLYFIGKAPGMEHSDSTTLTYE